MNNGMEMYVINIEFKTYTVLSYHSNRYDFAKDGVWPTGQVRKVSYLVAGMLNARQSCNNGFPCKQLL